MPNDFQSLPKLRDSISYLYVEHATIEQDAFSIVAIRQDGKIPIPVSSTTCLLLGPGTSVTHAAVKAMADNGCLIVWCGDKCSRFYASGIGETHSSENLLRQAALCMNAEKHLLVAKRMYIRRFGDLGSKEDYSLQQLRGMEGIRVREAYRLAAKATGIKWNARSYKSQDWAAADPINRALSEANSILYALCHAAIVSLGYSPALGFVHTGKQLSFVYDVADIYKANVTIPAAFESVQNPGTNLESSVRRCVRSTLQRWHVLKRIPEDLAWIFDIKEPEEKSKDYVGSLWSEHGDIPGGKNYSNMDDELW